MSWQWNPFQDTETKGRACLGRAASSRDLASLAVSFWMNNRCSTIASRPWRHMQRGASHVPPKEAWGTGQQSSCVLEVKSLVTSPSASPLLGDIKFTTCSHFLYRRSTPNRVGAPLFTKTMSLVSASETQGQEALILALKQNWSK